METEQKIVIGAKISNCKTTNSQVKRNKWKRSRVHIYDYFHITIHGMKNLVDRGAKTVEATNGILQQVESDKWLVLYCEVVESR